MDHYNPIASNKRMTKLLKIAGYGHRVFSWNRDEEQHAFCKIDRQHPNDSILASGLTSAIVQRHLEGIQGVCIEDYEAVSTI